MRPTLGDVIGGKYRVVRLIGDGGMGAVYEARHEVLGTAVALKFLHQELARRTGLAQRFLQEARVSANIQSVHVTRVTDVDSLADGTPYLVMELLSGESLQQLLDRKSKLKPDQAVDFALQILAGLEAAHAIGVVHRDLKPDNIFVTPSSGGPLLKLIDFGIAKLRATNEYNQGLTRAGALMGTPEYMAPEQLYSASEVDHRADIYSLGVMLFEMLSGTRPAEGEDAQVIVGKVLANQVLKLGELEPELSPALVQAVERAMAPDRRERHESALAMRQVLAALAGELSHAGRLAASPDPMAATGTAALPVTSVDAEPAAASKPGTEVRTSSVPRTLPPDDEPARQATADDPALSQRGATEQAAPIVARPSAASVPPWPRPPGAGAGTRRRRSRSAPTILALLLGLVITGGVVAAISWYRQNQEDDEALRPSSPPPETTLSALAESSPPPGSANAGGANTAQPIPRPTSTPAPQATRPGTQPGPAPHDAGAKPEPTFPPIVFPSALPPLPSSFPTTLPTAFPSTFPPLFPPASPAPKDSG